MKISASPSSMKASSIERAAEAGEAPQQPQQHPAAANPPDVFESREGRPPPGQDPALGYPAVEYNIDGTTTPDQVAYGGGPLLDHAVLHPIYVGDYWGTTAGQADRSWNDGFAQDYGKSSMATILQQYNVGPSSFGGSTAVPRAFRPGDRFTDEDAQKLVQEQLASGNAPRDGQGLYSIVLPPGVVLVNGDGQDSANDKVCGYHGMFTGADGKPVYYSVVVNADSQGNGVDIDGVGRDAVTVFESHEWAEAQTNPTAYQGPRGWTLKSRQADDGEEIGDAAVDALLQSDGYGHFDASRLWSRVDGYAYQEMLSIKDGLFEVEPGAKPATPKK